MLFITIYKQKKTYNIQYDYEQILKQLLSFKIVLKYSHAKTKFDKKSYKAQHFSAL